MSGSQETVAGVQDDADPSNRNAKGRSVKGKEDEGPDAQDSRVRSAGSILKSLNEIDTHSEQLGITLDAMVRSKDYSSFISDLHGPQIIEFLDFLDRVSFSCSIFDSG